jgi:hypothetical protein
MYSKYKMADILYLRRLKCLGVNSDILLIICTTLAMATCVISSLQLIFIQLTAEMHIKFVNRLQSIRHILLPSSLHGPRNARCILICSKQ